MLQVYDVTTGFPRHETWGLTSQLRRAAVSVPSNIAEGCGRDSDPELIRFLRIALGSINEMDYQLLLARDPGYLTPAAYQELVDSISGLRKMTIRFIMKIEHGRSDPGNNAEANQ